MTVIFSHAQKRRSFLCRIPSFLVTGTDTGVGKTTVSAGLAAELARRGLPVGVMKPFATGARTVGGRLVSDDALLLQAAARVDDPLELINPVCLKPPLAPEMAARVARRPITPKTVWSAYQILSQKHRPMVVEGVGGLLVPLFTGFTVADLAKRLRLPLLIVTRPALGTLNHTALTVHAARAQGLRILGLVIRLYIGWLDGFSSSRFSRFLGRCWSSLWLERLGFSEPLRIGGLKPAHAIL